MYPKLDRFLNEHNELTPYYKLSVGERSIIEGMSTSVNKLGFAVLLKVVMYLGYFPQTKKHIPKSIVVYLAKQLEISPFYYKGYKWKNATWWRHVKLIREITTLKPLNNEDFNVITEYVYNSTSLGVSRGKLFTDCVEKCRELKVELPSENELSKLVNKSYNSYYEYLYNNIYSSLSKATLIKMQSCFESNTKEKSFNWLKLSPGSAGMDTMLELIRKLTYLRTFDIDTIDFQSCSPTIIKKFYRRTRNDDTSKMQNRTAKIRYTLFAFYIYQRKMEVVDDIIEIFFQLVRRIEKRTDITIEKTVSKDVKKIYNKNNILRKVTLAIIDNPEGTIEEVILPIVKLDVFKTLADDYEGKSEEEYDIHKANIMKTKYTTHYRRMLKPLLDALEFKTNNPVHEQLAKAITLIHKYVDSQVTYYPLEEDIPFELLTGHWKYTAIDDNSMETRVKRHFFEMCILDKMEKALKCKELWVEEAYKFRNPELDLPPDWEKTRIGSYEKFNFPLSDNDLIEPIKTSMGFHLYPTNDYFADKQGVSIYQVGKKPKGFFKVPPSTKQDEPVLISEIKKNVLNKYGIVDLLDVLVEADRMIDFSKYFHTSASRQILSRDEVRERLLLTIFQLGTNLSLKHVHKAAGPNCSYQDLIYFRDRFLTPEYLRNAIRGLTNRILEVRNTSIWGNTTACASDGKQFGAWDQNLMAGSNPHYTKTGIMAYWHVDRHSACIYSQIKNCNSSEKAAMIEGLIHHYTKMELEANYVDSAGQSELAFAICHFLGIELLPRLKRIKEQRLYLPDKDIAKHLPNLKSVISRPIRWDLISSQYDKMVKHVVAIIEGIATPEAILRRFMSYNRTHPTYKAFIELGKAKKTLFLCRYLTDSKLRIEVHSGLNVVENWNSVNTYIYYGRQSEIQTNDPVLQEMAVLCLHLLQNAVILANTRMLDKVIIENNYLNKMNEADSRALTPLFTLNTNPYGNLNLDLYKPSFMEDAA